MASNNQFSDLGAEPVEDYTDLGAVPVDQAAAPAPAASTDFTDLGAEPVKDSNFFEGVRTFAIDMKSKLEQMAAAHKQQEEAKQAAAAQADADPANWSSSRFKKEAPKPQSPEDQAVFDATVQEKQLHEENLRKDYFQKKYGFDPEQQQKEFSSLMGPDVKIETLKPQSFFDKIRNGVSKLYQPDNAKSANILNLANYTGAPIPVIQKHYDEITKDLGLRDYPNAGELINAAMVLGLPVTIDALGPLAVAKGIAEYTVAKEGTERLILPAGKAVWQSMTAEPVRYEVGKLQDLFPEGMKDIGDISEFILYGAAAKGFDGLLSHPEAVKGGQRFMGELNGLRGRILEAMGVKLEKGLEPVPYEKLKKLYPDNWKDMVSSKEWNRYKSDLTEKVTAQDTAAENARQASEAKPAPEKTTVSTAAANDLGAVPVEEPTFQVPEFKNSIDAIAFGKNVAGNPTAITHLENARDEITPKIEELKTKTDTASFQEGYNLATKRQFINEALAEAQKVAAPAPPAAAPEVVTDPAQVQEIQNSIAEGTMILKSGKTNAGRKMEPAELESILRAVNNSKARIGEAPIEMPKQIPTKLPKGKKLVSFDVPEQDALNGLIQDIQDMEAYRKREQKDPSMPLGDQGTGKTIVTGYVPEYLQNQGVTKAGDLPILEKSLKGEPLTDKQHQRVLELIDLNMREMERRYGKSIEELYSELPKSEAETAIQLANEDEPLTEQARGLLQEGGSGDPAQGTSEGGGVGATEFPFGDNAPEAGSTKSIAPVKISYGDPAPGLPDGIEKYIDKKIKLFGGFVQGKALDGFQKRFYIKKIGEPGKKGFVDLYFDNEKKFGGLVNIEVDEKGVGIGTDTINLVRKIDPSKPLKIFDVDRGAVDFWKNRGAKVIDTVQVGSARKNLTDMEFPALNEKAAAAGGAAPKQMESRDLLGQAKTPEGGLKAKAPQAESPLTELKQAQSGERQGELFTKTPSGTAFAAPAGKPVSTPQTTNKGEAKEWQPKVLPAEKIAKLPKTLGGMEYVRALEMPELVRLAKEISGSTPQVARRMGAAYGRFYRRPGTKGSIKLGVQIFSDPDLAAGVMAHEIGHNIDWLPDQTLKRGNLIGRAISNVGTYMKNTFGPDLFDPAHPTGLNAKELRKELEALTTWWHPFTPVKGDTYTKYRFSSKELYAEFLSVLLNAPAKALEMAPKFYNAFFEHMDAKPDVKQSFFELQDLLNDPTKVVKSREADIVRMFEKSRDQFENLLNQKTAAKKSLRFLLKYHFIDKNAAILDARNKVAAKSPINPEEDPKYLLEESSMIGAFVKSHLDNLDPIYQDLRASGLDFDKDFGQYLFLKRVQADRAEVANPLGHNPETAGRQLDAMKARLGTDRYAELEGYVKRARDWFSGINELLKEDILNEKQIATVEGNNDYAPFRVTKYLKEYASAGFAHQFGTLNEIENPGASMVLKGVAMLRLYKRNLIEKNTMKFLLDSGDVEPAVVKTFDGGVHVKEKDGVDVVKWREGGKWQAAYADPFIADSFKYDDSGALQTIGEVFNQILLNNQLFRPVYITYNLGFQAFNLIKDFTRSWKNTPGLTFGQAIKNYGRAFPHALARVQEKVDPLIQQMEREGALNITMNDMMMGKDSTDTEIDALMAKYGLRPEEKKVNPLLYPVKKLMDGIKFMGDVIETIPKVAGFYALEDMSPAERAYYVRNYVGTPNFKRKGKMFPVYNSVFMFSNIFKEGLRSDTEAAFRNPKTRSGFWWKTIKMNILPKILMGLGLAGLFGKAIKDNYEKQTEYDKTNYITIPLGTDERGKAIYARIPQDETGRLVGGLFWKTISRKEPKDLLAFTGGQLPGMSPALNMMTTWGEYLTGGNPKDNFRSQTILTDDEAKAGGVRSLEPMLRWTANQTGLVHMDLRDRLKNETLLQKTLALTPVLNRFIRITDYGQVENLKGTIEKAQGQEATKRLETKDLIIEGIHAGKTPAEAARTLPPQERAKFMQKYVKAEHKTAADATEQALGQAFSNDQKLQVLDEIAGRYDSTAEYRKALIPYYKNKAISLDVLNKAVRNFNNKKRGA